MKSALIALVVIALFPASRAVAENSIKVDQIVQNGIIVGGGRVIASLPVEIRLRWTVGEWPVRGGTNGFAVYSFRNGSYTDGRDPASGVYFYPGYWDGIAGLGIYSCDGLERDTVAFKGFAIDSRGIPAGYSDNWTALRTGNLVAGDTLGIDTSWFPPGGAWLWFTDAGDIIPDWPGPYFFPVVNCCAYAGDCNFDGKITIADLTTLVHFIFPPHTPLLCDDAANVNGSTGTTPINVADVTYMVSHLFRGGPPPIACE